MFDFTPFMKFFTDIADRFGGKLALAVIVNLLLLAYPVTETPTETIAVVKYVAVAVVTVAFFGFRYLESKNAPAGDVKG